MSSFDQETAVEPKSPQGSWFGRYELIASLGQGGMADVFLAVSRGPGGFNKLVVIKRLRSTIAEDPVFRLMFLDEARLAARLNHPNVVQTNEVGEYDGFYFLAMEYLEGQPLRRVANQAKRLGQSLGPVVSARIVADALWALHYAHELRDYDGTPLHIIHRDVSPHNIFVTYDGQVKLVDFGIAKATSSSADTQSGVLKGKVAYMAPEQVTGEVVDRRADVFAMGIVLWELLTESRLMLRETAAATLHCLLSAPIPDPSEIAPTLDPELGAIAMRALRRERDARFQSAAEMRAALIEVLSRHKLRDDEIATRMSTMFAAERADIERRIQECMREGGSALAPDHSPDSPGSGIGALDLSPSRGLISLSSETSSPILVRGSPVPASTSPSPGVTHVATGIGTWAPLRAWWALAAAAVLVVVAVLFALYPRDRPMEAPLQVTSTVATARPEIILSLHGSNTIGAELAPLLAEAFLKHADALDVSREAGSMAHETLVVGKAAGKPTVAIEIDAEGSSTGFEDLGKGACDIGMASRSIRTDEAQALAEKGLGDLASPASEHVLGLDGIAVIVHPNNPIRSLSLAQLRGIFSGSTVDWSAVGGARPSGPITVYARDDNSGTYDTFKHLVLEDDALTPSAKRFVESEQLSDAVATDSSAIGFIGLVYVRASKAIAVSEKNVAALYPSTFTVATEDYALSRRLFLYTPVHPKNPKALEFVNFALSHDGQMVVKSAGFVDLGVTVREGEACTDKCSKRYLSATLGARRLSINFRFRTGSTELDSRALRDIDRLLLFLRPYANPRVALFGFSDSSGDPSENVELSRIRAHVVSEELGPRGIHAAAIEGFGPEMPVASNAAEAGREKNRRVEVWLLPTASPPVDTP
jgi:phosphate transport system substrate-binding protein